MFTKKFECNLRAITPTSAEGQVADFESRYSHERIGDTWFYIVRQFAKLLATNGAPLTWKSGKNSRIMIATVCFPTTEISVEFHEAMYVRFVALRNVKIAEGEFEQQTHVRVENMRDTDSCYRMVADAARAIRALVVAEDSLYKRGA